MNPENLELLMDRWMNDPTFRADLRANPEKAAESVGVTLNADEMAALKNVDWNLSDDELSQRVSKMGSGGEH
ncbi:MAG: Os1348 family NHLP clan protein [Armatimonadota bacterium]